MPQNTYQVLLGGTYATEATPGTASDPDDPTDLNFSYNLDPVYMSIPVCGMNELRCVGRDHVEIFDSNYTSGQWIQLKQLSIASSSSGSVNDIVFDGIIVNKHLVISGDTEHCEIIAYDHGSYLIHRIALHGQLRRSHAQEQTYFTSGMADSSIVIDMTSDVVTIDTPMVFNPDGEPNMTADAFTPSGGVELAEPPTFPIFEVPFRNQVTSAGQPLTAKYWTVIDAINYLLNVYNVSWCIDPTSYETTILAGAIPNNPVISNISCEGDSLAKALSKLLTPYNYCWWVDPALNTNNLHNIHFFQKGNGRTMKVHLSARGTKAKMNQSNMVHADLLIDNAATVNYLQSYGDRISFTTLAHTNPPSAASPKLPKLVPAWNNSDLKWPSSTSGQPNWWDAAFCQNYCNPNLLTPPQDDETQAVYGVGRMWIVNLGEDPNVNLEDLSKELCLSSTSSGMSSSSSSGGSPAHSTVTGTNSIDPRRFEKPALYQTNTAGGLLSQEEVQVEISVDNGGNWQIVDRSDYKLLSNSMGIVFTAADMTQLGAWYGSSSSAGMGSSTSSVSLRGYWQALKDGVLQLRIVCSVKSDERVHATIQNDGSQFPLAVGSVFNNTGYKRTVYNDAINDAVYYVSYPPSKITQDDTPALTTLTQQQLANTNRTVISGAVQVLLAAYGDYLPGDSITGISNPTGTTTRAIKFSSNPSIMHILYKFQEQQVSLTLDNNRVGSVVKAKPLNQAANMRQHKLGVENPSAMQGGHNAGNFLPETNNQGDNPAANRFYDSGGG